MEPAQSVTVSVVVEGLVKRFGDFIAVSGISFKTMRGEIFGFLGPNGAGKSTTIRMLCGLLRPSAGRAMVAGFDVTRQAEEVRQHIGYMSQKFSLYNDLQVVENLRFFGGLYGVGPRQLKERIDWAVAMAGLEGRENELVSNLATGWKQRLALGTAVLHRPPVLFLDEPTSGVDPISRRRFWDLIHEMAAQGVTVFVSTHYMDEAEYCNRLAMINRGELVALGSPGELKRRHMRGQLVKIDCAPLGAALRALGQVEGVLESAVFGNSIHAVLGQSVAPDAVAQALRAGGITCGAVSPIHPSLEDVFVTLSAAPAKG